MATELGDVADWYAVEVWFGTGGLPLLVHILTLPLRSPTLANDGLDYWANLLVLYRHPLVLAILFVNAPHLCGHLVRLQRRKPVHEVSADAGHVPGVESYLGFRAIKTVDPDLQRQEVAVGLEHLVCPLGLLDQLAAILRAPVIGVHVVPSLQ